MDFVTVRALDQARPPRRLPTVMSGRRWRRRAAG